mgnify:CR=1 FL=1|jgi:hypothetical protein
MNKLTERLLAEGYTKENHPDYVEWSNWQDFEYTQAYILQTVWEAPCGLLKKGSVSLVCGWGSHMGVDYRPENNNPRLGCPYYDEKPCPHRYNTEMMGWNCVFHQTTKPYDYEQSVEKIQDAENKIKSAALREVTGQFGYCACLEWDRPKRKYAPRYDVSRCISIQCKNEVCAITKRPRHLQKVNVYYDILKVREWKKGLFSGVDRAIEKGIKVFDHAIARTDAEMWLKMNGKNLVPKKTKLERQESFLSKHHGRYDDYDWVQFSLTPQNVRIEARESRDLMQDLMDIREGIKVTHASDTKKAAAQAKRDRKASRQKAKKRKTEKIFIQKLTKVINEGVALDGEEASENLKRWSLAELNKRNHLPGPEQPSMFEEAQA